MHIHNSEGSMRGRGRKLIGAIFYMVYGSSSSFEMLERIDAKLICQSAVKSLNYLPRNGYHEKAMDG